MRKYIQKVLITFDAIDDGEARLKGIQNKSDIADALFNGDLHGEFNASTVRVLDDGKGSSRNLLRGM